MKEVYEKFIYEYPVISFLFFNLEATVKSQQGQLAAEC